MRYDGHCVACAMVSQAQNNPTLSVEVGHHADKPISLRSRLCLLLCPKPATSHDFHRIDGKKRQRFGIVYVWRTCLSREKSQTQSIRFVPCSLRHALPVLRFKNLVGCQAGFHATRKRRQNKPLKWPKLSRQQEKTPLTFGISK